MPLERTHPIIPQKAAPGQIRMWGPRRRKGSLPKVAPVVPERAAVPPPARALPPPPWRSSSRRRRRVRWATDRSVPPARPPLINVVYSPIRFFQKKKCSISPVWKVLSQAHIGRRTEGIGECSMRGLEGMPCPRGGILWESPGQMALRNGRRQSMWGGKRPGEREGGSCPREWNDRNRRRGAGFVPVCGLGDVSSCVCVVTS